MGEASGATLLEALFRIAERSHLDWPDSRNVCSSCGDFDAEVMPGEHCDYCCGAAADPVPIEFAQTDQRLNFRRASTRRFVLITSALCFATHLPRAGPLLHTRASCPYFTPPCITTPLLHKYWRYWFARLSEACSPTDSPSSDRFLAASGRAGWRLAAVLRTPDGKPNTAYVRVQRRPCACLAGCDFCFWMRP